MASLSTSMHLVQDYISHFAAANNDPFDIEYADVLAPYKIGVAAPTNAPIPADVSRQNYSASGNVSITFMLWLATLGLAVNVYLGRIVLLHSVYQFMIRMGCPATKCDSKAFASMGNVVTGTVALYNWT